MSLHTFQPINKNTEDFILFTEDYRSEDIVNIHSKPTHHSIKNQND